jgi:hypothetical protein
MRSLAVILLCSIAAACALAPDEDSQQSKLAVLDAYWIAHGMAQSYGERPDADPAVMEELSRLDARAGAIRHEAQASGDDTADTEKAVAALSDYAASQSAISR